MLSVKCPNCGASIQFEKDRIPGFCSFCGSQLALPEDLREQLKHDRDIESQILQHQIKVDEINQLNRKNSIETRNLILRVLLPVGIPLLLLFAFFIYILNKF